RSLFLFFFQAEDGIRVFHVTGVQTCALPISHARPVSRKGFAPAPRSEHVARSRAKKAPRRGFFAGIGPALCPRAAHRLLAGRREIGRASCRERGSGPVGARRIKENSGTHMAR